MTTSQDITDEEVVKACRDTMHPRKGNAVAKLIEQRPDQSSRAVISALRRAYDKGLINYGVTIEQAWPTAAGFDLLRPRAARHFPLLGGASSC